MTFCFTLRFRGLLVACDFLPEQRTARQVGRWHVIEGRGDPVATPPLPHVAQEDAHRDRKIARLFDFWSDWTRDCPNDEDRALRPKGHAEGQSAFIAFERVAKALFEPGESQQVPIGLSQMLFARRVPMS